MKCIGSNDESICNHDASVVTLAARYARWVHQTTVLNMSSQENLKSEKTLNSQLTAAGHTRAFHHEVITVRYQSCRRHCIGAG